MSTLLDDLRYAMRHMRRRWTTTLVAVLTLAIGLGSTTAVFTIVDAVLLRPLPYRASGQLVSVWETFPLWRNQPALSAQWDRIALSYQEYSRVATEGTSFEEVGAAYFRTVRVDDVGRDVTEIPVARGSVSLLGVLGVRTELGRWFLPGEEGPRAPHVAVLPHAMWQTRYGLDPEIVGRPIQLDGEPYDVIGVLPASFAFGSVGPFAKDVDTNAVWVPIGSGRGDLTENSQNYEVIARLRSGISLTHASDEIRPIIRAGRDPATHDVRLVSRIEAETGASRAPLVTLFAAAILLLAITCANLAALLLGEASRRSGEMRTRLALGAVPGRLIRQLLTESVALAFTGAIIAVPVSVGLIRVLLALAPERLPRETTIALGWPTLLFACAAALATGVLFGLLPARLFGRTSASAAGISGDRAVTARRAHRQQWMIAAEAALSMILLVAAGLLLRSLWLEEGVAPGFQTSRLLAVSVAAPASTDVAGRTPGQFFDDAGRALRALPGVEWVSATSNVPLGGNDGQWAVSADPSVKLSNSSPSAQHDAVWPGYFAAMGIAIVEGRALGTEDTPDHPRVAVVNQTMAHQLWPGRSVVGLRFLAPSGGARTIVGVAADTRHRGLGTMPRATFYESVRQINTSRITLLMRTSGDPAVLAPSARAAVRSVDRTALVERVITMDALVADSLKTERFRALVLQFFGVAALIVTAVGLAGVAIHSATERMRELCVRMAIGATPAGVRRLVLGQYVRGLAGGLGAGALIAAGLMHVASSSFAGVTWYDPATYAGAALVLLATALTAGWMGLLRLDRTNLSDELGAR